MVDVSKPPRKDQPGIIDPERLDRYLLSIEGKFVNGLKIVCTGRDAEGRRLWQLQEDKQ